MRRAVSVLVFVVAASLPALAAEQAGVSAAVRGQVALARAAAPARPVASGEAILMEDAISSGPRSGMQILLLDETVFTLGPDSEIVVDEFVYDPAKGSGALSARITKGVFRFVSGKIAREDPQDVKLELPAGTIGVRGTVLGGRVDAMTKQATVVLLGEGRRNDAGAKPAAIDVCNAGACVAVTRTGWGTRIEGAGEPPLEPFRLPEAEVDAILAALAPEPVLAQEGTMDDGSAKEQSGATDAKALQDAVAQMDRLDEADALARLTAFASQDEVETFVAENAIRDGVTSIGDLLSVDTGVARYEQAGIPLSDGGSFDVKVGIDFAARTVQGSFENIDSPLFTLTNETVAGVESYSQLAPSLEATFEFNGVSSPNTFCGPGCPMRGRVAFFNKDNTVAAKADADLYITSGANFSEGAGDVPRVQ